jgi:hypothetical protein
MVAAFTEPAWVAEQPELTSYRTSRRGV